MVPRPRHWGRTTPTFGPDNTAEDTDRRASINYIVLYCIVLLQQLQPNVGRGGPSNIAGKVGVPRHIISVTDGCGTEKYVSPTSHAYAPRKCPLFGKRMAGILNSGEPLYSRVAVPTRVCFDAEQPGLSLLANLHIGCYGLKLNFTVLEHKIQPVGGYFSLARPISYVMTRGARGGSHRQFCYLAALGAVFAAA